MLEGQPYHDSDPELVAEQAITAAWLARYNAALGQPVPVWRSLLAERLAAVGEGSIARPPFHCDYGWNIRIGSRVFVNFNCIILDVAPVSIGSNVWIGGGAIILPGVTIGDELHQS